MTYAHLTTEQLRALRSQVGDIAREAIERELSERELAARRPIELARIELERPLRLVVTFDALESDNKRTAPMGAAKRKAGQKYREARARFRQQLRDQYQAAPVSVPVRIHALVWFPDLQARDVCNYAKIIGDALKDIVIADDRWTVARSNTQEAAGVDVDNPRCEIMIEPWRPAA